MVMARLRRLAMMRPAGGADLGAVLVEVHVADPVAAFAGLVSDGDVPPGQAAASSRCKVRRNVDSEGTALLAPAGPGAVHRRQQPIRRSPERACRGEHR